MSKAYERTAIVTGGNRGIGLAIVEELLADKWAVISISRGGLSDHGVGLRSISADLATSEGIERSLNQIHEMTSRLDLLVNNAGAIQENEDLMSVTESSMLASWRLHVLAPLFLSRGLVDLMAQAPNPTVVNMGSIYGSVIDPDVIAYGASKCGLNYVTSALTATLAPHVRVNAILPGHVDTAMTSDAPPEFLEEILSKTPLKRLATTSEIAQVVRFLASTNASFVSGASVTVDGGFMSAR